jgi:hypothetical protein
MRTTIMVDDRLGQAALHRARREGMSFSAFVARAIEEYLTRQPPQGETPAFRLVTVGGGGPRPGLDLDRTSELLVAEDEAAYESGEET